MKTTTAFPRRLRSLRKKRGLSVRKAALLLGISPSMLQRYEAGLNSPSIDKIVHFAVVLNTKVDDLIGKKGAA